MSSRILRGMALVEGDGEVGETPTLVRREAPTPSGVGDSGQLRAHPG